MAKTTLARSVAPRRARKRDWTGTKTNMTTQDRRTTNTRASSLGGWRSYIVSSDSMLRSVVPKTAGAWWEIAPASDMHDGETSLSSVGRQCDVSIFWTSGSRVGKQSRYFSLGCSRLHRQCRWPCQQKVGRRPRTFLNTLEEAQALLLAIPTPRSTRLFRQCWIHPYNAEL